MLAPHELPPDLGTDLPDRPITTVRDIQFLYGKLYLLATAGGGEYAAYLTPEAAEDLLDEEESLIVVRVDLSGDEPQLAENPVQVMRYSRSLIAEAAHSKYPAARGIDHSITHQSGRDASPEKLARYARERLLKWPTDPSVAGAAKNHPDGNLVDALAELGENDGEMERIDAEVQGRLGGPRTALVTVQIRLEAGGAYLWPGEIDVLQEVMRARKLSKLISKGKAEEAAGPATCLVSGEFTRTVGTSEDPLNYYLTKQMEKFPGLDPDRSWQTHSISEDAALTVPKAEEFVDACTYATFGATIYYLPYYLGHIGVERARELYTILRGMLDQGDSKRTAVERAYENMAGPKFPERAQKLRFYVAAVQKHQMSRWDVYGETLNGSILYPVDLARTHEKLLGTWIFNNESGDARSPPLPTHESWGLLRAEDQLRAVTTGWYFHQTFPGPPEDQNASADDFRIRALVSVLGGEPLPIEKLIQHYVDRIVERQQENLRDGSDWTFPRMLVASQFAQLTALSKNGLLTSDSQTYQPITESGSYDGGPIVNDETTSSQTNGGGARARARKLSRFLEETPALREDDERRASFLLGALVGHVGSYQQHNGVSLTLVDQHPVEGLSTKNIKRRVQEVLAKDIVYSRENDMASTMYAEVVDALREAVIQKDSSEWDIGLEDLRFYYALGVTYGLNDTSAYQDGEKEQQATITDGE